MTALGIGGPWPAATPHGQPAVFLDRDGVLNRPIVREGKPFPPGTLAEVEILPEVAEACALLKENGYLLVIATNQPDVGRGSLARSAVEEIHAWMLATLPIDHVKTCYHGGASFGQPCTCRKPQPGMLFQAAQDWQIDLPRSFMVGDRWRDIECGRRAGCRTIFVDWGYRELLKEKPDYVVSSLSQAAAVIIGQKTTL